MCMWMCRFNIATPNLARKEDSSIGSESTHIKIHTLTHTHAHTDSYYKSKHRIFRCVSACGRALFTPLRWCVMSKRLDVWMENRPATWTQTYIWIDTEYWNVAAHSSTVLSQSVINLLCYDDSDGIEGRMAAVHSTYMQTQTHTEAEK